MEEAKSAYHLYQQIPIHFVKIKIESALDIAKNLNIYAYDAYLLSCATTYHATLIS